MSGTYESRRRDARRILAAALARVRPETVMPRAFPGGAPTSGTVRMAAVGKAAPGMATLACRWAAFAETLLVVPRGAAVDRAHFPVGATVLESDHPLPTEASAAAGEALLSMARRNAPGDTLLLLVSGGGSALAEAPAVELSDLVETNRRMLASTLDILEVNCVRKHLSLLKGGQLALASEGRIVALYVSDVPDDDPSVVASGLVAPDPTTFDDARECLVEAELWEGLPKSVRRRLETGAAGDVPETPKPDDPAFDRVEHHVLVGNHHALLAAEEEARALGYRPLVVEEGLSGEARDAADRLLAIAKREELGHVAEGSPCAMIAGGETVVRVEGDGLGGRNQELALAMVKNIAGKPMVVTTLSTDGVDGPTDAAGAVADGDTLGRAKERGLD
ncbi:MAG: glycerate kinase type-2 family protein, partial [Methanobacteriota archaeon]